MITSHLIRFCTITMVCVTPVLSSCSHINMKQMAYEVLRQEDCRRNELEVFCSRNFASEYLEYERLRQDYIRNRNQHQWRVSQSSAKLEPRQP